MIPGAPSYAQPDYNKPTPYSKKKATTTTPRSNLQNTYWADVSGGLVTNKTAPQSVVNRARAQGLGETQPIWGLSGGGGGGGGGGGSTYTSSGGGRSGGWGGGGGGGGGGGMTQAGLDAMLALLQAAKPQDLRFDPYKGKKFYAFNNQPYQQARQGLRTAVRDDRASANTAYDEALAEMANIRGTNPFANATYATDPGVSAAMQRMMAAQGGAGEQAAVGQAGEAAQADRAFANVLALLGANQEAFNQGTARSIEGDRRRFNESLDSEQRMLNQQISLARSQALAEYQKEKWAYGESIARSNYENRMSTINQNITNMNAYRQGVAQSLSGVIGSAPGLDYSKVKEAVAAPKKKAKPKAKKK